MIEIKVKGLQKEFDRLQAQILSLKQAELRRVGERMVQELRDATPVRTGKARDGWDYEIIGDRLFITNDVEYIKDLNMGNSPQAPPAFIEQVVMQQPGVTIHGNIVKYEISVN